MSPSLPASIVGRLAEPGRAARTPEVSFSDFMQAEEYPDERPAVHGIGPTTARQYQACVRQLGRQVAGDERAYFDAPPDWQAILKWRDAPERGGKARVEGHRRALLWLSAWWGQGGPYAPPFIRHRWNTTKNIAKAVAMGTFLQRERFLVLPRDISRLLSARPNEARLKLTRNWKHPRHRRPARAMDATWLTMVYLALYTGCRPNELATLRLRNSQPERGGIVGWAQPKNHGRTRDVTIPETFVWHSQVDPSLDHYLRYVRPQLAHDASPDFVFLNKSGRKWDERHVTGFVGRGMSDALAGGSTGGHGLRRACATYRYVHGWSLHDVAELLDDREVTISESYIDWTWVRSLPAGSIPRGLERPRVPRIRPSGVRTGRPRSTREALNPPVAEDAPRDQP